MPKKDNRKNRSRKQRADDARTRIKNTIVDFQFGGKARSKKKYDCQDFENNWAGRVETIVGHVESALRFLDFCADQPADVDAEEDRRSRSRSPSPTFPIDEDDTEHEAPKSVPKSWPVKKKPSEERAKTPEKEKHGTEYSNKNDEAMTMEIAQRKLDEYRERINKREGDREDTSLVLKEFKEIEESLKAKKINFTTLKDTLEKFESAHFAEMTVGEMYDKIDDLTKKIEDLTDSAEVEKGEKALSELEKAINENVVSIAMNAGKIDGMGRKLTQQLKEFEIKYIPSKIEERKERKERKESKERKDKKDGPMTEDQMQDKLEQLRDSIEGEEAQNALQDLQDDIFFYIFSEKKSMDADQIDDMDRKLTQQLKEFERKYIKSHHYDISKDAQAEYISEYKKYEKQVKSMPKTQWDSGRETIDWDTWEDENDVTNTDSKKLREYSRAIDEASARARRGEPEHEELQKMTRDVKEFNELISKALAPKTKKPSVANKNKDSPASSPPETSKLKKDELQTKIKGELNLIRDTVNKLNEGSVEVVSEEHVEELKTLENRLNPPSEDGKKVKPLKHDLQNLYGSIAPFKDKLKNAYSDFTSIYSEVRSKPPRKIEKKLESNDTTKLQQLKKLVKKAIAEAEDQIKASYDDQDDADDDLEQAKILVNRKAPKDKDVKDQLEKINRKHKKFLRAEEYKDAYEKASEKASSPKPTARRGPKKMERSVANQDLFNDLRAKYQLYKKLAKSNKNDDKFAEKFKDYSKAKYSEDEKNKDIAKFIEELKKEIDEEESTKSSKATVHKDLEKAPKDYKKIYDAVALLFPKITNTSDREKYMKEFEEFPHFWALQSVQEATDQSEKVRKFFEKVNAAASQDKAAGHKKNSYIPDPDMSAQAH